MEGGAGLLKEPSDGLVEEIVKKKRKEERHSDW